MTTRAVAEALDQALARLMLDDATLADRLNRYAVTLRELNQPFAEAVDRLVLRLESVTAGNEAPKLGEVLPRSTSHGRAHDTHRSRTVVGAAVGRVLVLE